MNITLTVLRSPHDSYVWQSTGESFGIGRNPELSLVMTGEGSHLVSWQHAVLEQHGDALVVRDSDSTNGTYVNGQRIQSPTMVGPGDEIWLGDRGPRLRITQVVCSPSAVAVAHSISGVSSSKSTPDPMVQLLAETNRSQQKSLLVLAGLGMAALLLGAFGMVWFFDTQRAPLGMAKLPEPPAPSGSTVPKESVPPSMKPAVPGPTLPPENKPVAPPVDSWQAVRDALKESVYLVVVEEPKSGAMWGLANATLVSPTRLLTTGVIGVELAKFQHRGHRLHLLRQSLSQLTKLEKVLIHAEAQHEQPEQQIYFDFALLVSSAPLTGKPVPLATAEEFAVLENGWPLASVAIELTDEPLDRFQRFEPQLLPNKILALSRLSEASGSPQLASLRGSFVNKPIGCPIVNEQGHLVGIYADAAQAEPGVAASFQIHYMPLIAPQVIQLGLGNEANPLWIPPRLPAETKVKNQP